MLSKKPLVALLTDYGLSEECVAVCKGVILKKNADTAFIDITHFIEPYNIRKASFVLYSASKWIDADIFLAIVDPGVGGKRSNLVVETKNGVFIGPDNGLLTQAIKNAGIRKIINATNSQYFIKPVSETFHGRDIFSSLTAHILSGTDITNFGNELKFEDLAPALWNKPEIVNEKIVLEIIDSDNFGTLRTNYNPQIELDISDKINITPGKRAVLQFNSISTIIPVVRTYSDVEESNLGILFDSTNHMAIFANKASAQHKLRLRPGDKVILKVID